MHERRNIDVMEMSTRVDCKVLKWSRHVELMNGERLTKRVDESELEGRRNRARPCTWWRDRVLKNKVHR